MVFLILPNSCILEQDVIKVSIALLDSSDPSTAGVAFSLLSAGLIANAALSQQMLLVLLRNAKQVGLFAQDTPTRYNTEVLLDKALCQFANTSFHSLLAQANATLLKDAAAAQSGERRGPSTGALSVEKLSLGDNLEIWIGAEWVVGTIVKSNALTGEVHVEHPKSGTPRTVSVAAASTMVSVLPKSSRKLRPVAAQRSALSNTDGATPSALATVASEGEAVLPSAVPEYTEEEANSALGRVVSLVFGSDNLPATPALTATGSLKRSAATSSPVGEDLPLCENDHRCQVVAISPSSAGFMCGVCSKLYSAGFDMSPPAGSDLPRFPPSRFGQAMYKWCCVACQYDVCLACFPNSEYPAGGLPSYFAAESSSSHSDSIKRCTVDLTNLPSRSTSAKSTSEGLTGPATRCTVCLMGQNAQSSCKVRAEASSTSAEISRVNHGSVIDVLDLPGSPFFQLFNGAGYVKKQPGRLCYWKRLPRDRYNMHSEEDVAYFSDTVEITPLMGSLGPLGNSSSSGAAQARVFAAETESENSVGVESAAGDPAQRAVDLVELLLRRDAFLKQHSAQEGQGSVVELDEVALLILQSAHSLFELVR